MECFRVRKKFIFTGSALVTLVVIAWTNRGLNDRTGDYASAPLAAHDVHVRKIKDRNRSCGKPTNTTQWTPPLLPKHLQNVDGHDKQLARHVCEQWIIPPFTGPRHLFHPKTTDYSQQQQSTYIDGLLRKRENGFYIECGAATGEGLSNSLFFEKERNWSGLLIEANPKNFKEVLAKRRHAYMISACLSTTTTPALLDFTMGSYLGGLTDNMDEAHKTRLDKKTQKKDAGTIKIQCFPLVTILKAINITHVDYFSLDIEGAEMAVLNSFPFNEIKVDVISVEYSVRAGRLASKQKRLDIIHLLVDKFGYRISSYRSNLDIILVKGV